MQTVWSHFAMKYQSVSHITCNISTPHVIIVMMLNALDRYTQESQHFSYSTDRDFFKTSNYQSMNQFVIIVITDIKLLIYSTQTS